MEGEHHNIVSYSVYGKVLISLIALLALSVLAAWLNLGVWVIVIAMSIAIFKAALVLTWFMHLKYDSILIKVMAGLAILIIIIIFVLLFFDYWFR
jgi:cytochrome c oxidase subunit IV